MIRKWLLSFAVLLFWNSLFSQINQLDSLGLKTGLWVEVPDSVNIMLVDDRFEKNHIDDLNLYFIPDSIKFEIYDTAIKRKAYYKNGKINGVAEYSFGKNIPIAEHTYQNGVLHGIARIYAGSFKSLYELITYNKGKREGFCMFFNGDNVESDFYVDNEQIFLASYKFNRSALYFYDKGKIRNGKYILTYPNNDYVIIKYKNGEIANSKYIYSKDISIKIPRRKGGSRPYWWGRIIKLFTKKDQSRFKIWIDRNL
jgi:hypothetical protein